MDSFVSIVVVYKIVRDVPHRYKINTESLAVKTNKLLLMGKAKCYINLELLLDPINRTGKRFP